VAVRAKKLEVLEPVVVAVAVDVMERDREWPTLPVDDAAALAFAALEPQRDEPLLEMAPIALPGKELV